MKKLTLILLCIATLGLASCKKDTIVTQSTPNITVITNVASNSWILSNDQLEYTVNINIPQIDRYHIDNEATLVYISYDNGVTYAQMPFVYNVDAYSYEVFNGGIKLIIQSSDNQDFQPNRPNSTVRIKVVLISSE